MSQFICYPCKILHNHQCEGVYNKNGKVIICKCHCQGQFTKLPELWQNSSNITQEKLTTIHITKIII